MKVNGRFSRFQLLMIGVGAVFSGVLLVRAVIDQSWSNQPLIRAFYDFDMLAGARDADGLFHAPAFEALRGLPLAEARRRVEAAGLACDPPDPALRHTFCTYGYETQTGCCRFRIRLDFGGEDRIAEARGDKTGRCPR